MKRTEFAIFFILLVCSNLQAQEISEIRFHGNHSIPDEELLELIGIDPGNSYSESLVQRIEEQLKRCGRFESYEIRKRYQGLSLDSPVVLIISVREKIPVKKKFMFFPVISMTDEYGWTFGAKITSIDLFGLGERITYPLTLGGVDQASAHGLFPLDRDYSTLIRAEFGISSRNNPRFLVSDRRTEAAIGFQKNIWKTRLNFDIGWTDVQFGEVGDRLGSVGAGWTVDFRKQEVLPRNAFYAEIGWRRSNILDGGGHFNQFSADIRGYKSLGRLVLAAQVAYLGADRMLPDYQKPFLGGAGTLRGWKAGSFVGDNRLIGSAELRFPVTSPVTPVKAGILGFFDTGTVWNHGTSLSQSRFYNGAGAGLFIFAFGLGFKVDVGYDLEKDVRVHFTTNFRF